MTYLQERIFLFGCLWFALRTAAFSLPEETLCLVLLESRDFVFLRAREPMTLSRVLTSLGVLPGQLRPLSTAMQPESLQADQWLG